MGQRHWTAQTRRVYHIELPIELSIEHSIEHSIEPSSEHSVKYAIEHFIKGLMAVPSKVSWKVPSQFPTVPSKVS